MRFVLELRSTIAQSNLILEAATNAWYVTFISDVMGKQNNCRWCVLSTENVVSDF